MSSQTKLIKDILSTYESILENRNVLEAEDVYDNVDFENIGEGDPASDNADDKINTALLQDVQNAAKSAGLKVKITTAVSGHGTKTKGGGDSRHPSGNAVDVARINGIGSGGATNSTDGNAKFRELGNKLKDELVSMGYIWNSESGNPKAVLWQTNTGGNHFNHVHISNNTKSTSQLTSDNKPSDSSLSTTSSSDYEETSPDPLVRSWANSISDFFGFNEQKYDKNLKIKSPTYSKKLEENLNKIKNLLK